MNGGDLLLGLRVALSLACVLGLLWYIGRRMSGGPRGLLQRRQRAATMAVVGRQSLGGKTGLALVEVGGRRLLLGISERGVNLLTELEPDLAEAVAVGPAGSAPAAHQVPGPVELDPVLHRQPLTARAIARPGMPPLSTPAARKPAVPKPRSPLEGSILDAASWRRAVVAVQERTLRH